MSTTMAHVKMNGITTWIENATIAILPTHYRILLPNTTTNVDTPIPWIVAVKLKRHYEIKIKHKDFTVTRIRFASREEQESVAELLAFAVQNFVVPSFPSVPSTDWATFDLKQEYHRMIAKLSDNKLKAKWRFSNVNESYKCPSYPNLLLVPAAVTDELLSGTMQVRRNKRIVCATYLHSNGASILRSSLPLMLKNKSADLFTLGLFAGTNLQGNGDLLIMDLRPILHAIGGPITEGLKSGNEMFYKPFNVWFHQLQGASHVRAMLPILYSGKTDKTSVETYVRFELQAASTIARQVDTNCTMLVHCADGWDRTAQVVSLAQIMLDPIYRTMNGFAKLIEKDWVYFGHQFQLRMAHGIVQVGNKKPKHMKEFVPIFYLFLQAVKALWLHNCAFFEFNEKFLDDIYINMMSRKYANFESNTVEERLKMQYNHLNMWHAMLNSTSAYKNVQYDSQLQAVLQW